MCSLAAPRLHAQTAALIAVGDPTQISELQLAKVMADDSSLWLSVHLRGHTRLALVVPEAVSESAVAADAWLRALDFATRTRVAPPPGPLASCGAQAKYELADSGLPEPQRILASALSSENSELELRRRLLDVGLPVDVSQVAHFTSRAQPPFRVALYDVPALGGSTDALRLIDRGHPEELPSVELSGASKLPLSVIVLAKTGVRPVLQGSADASAFPVVYRASDASSDYLSARGAWLAQNEKLWLNEVQGGAGLFSGTVFPTGDRVASVVSRYLGALANGASSACETNIGAARERSSSNAADFACDDADDLSRTMTEVGFDELRLSRFHGTLGADGERFRVAGDGSFGPLLFATDFDQGGCAQPVVPPISGGSPPTSPPMTTTPVVISAPEDPYYGPAPTTTTTTTGTYTEASCTGSVSDSSSNDSCSGDSSSNDSSSDSCSGDSSSEDSGGESCSGDSSSEDSSSESCSGDSSSEDSSGESCSGDSSSEDSSSDSCSGNSSSDSEYDGDTCSGSSADSHPSRAKGAALRSQGAEHRSRPRPRRVRLSLLTWLIAALALPLRRLSASR